MTFIAFFANHHTDCFFLPSSGPHCWPPTLSSLFNLSSQFWPEWESQLPSNGSFFPSHEMNSRPGPAAPPAPSFRPCPLWETPFCTPLPTLPSLMGSLRLTPRLPTHTEQQPVSPAYARGLAESLWTGALLPSSTPSSGTLYLQGEWWNTGNSLQRDQANLPRRAWSSQSGSWCPRIRPSLFWHPVGEWVQISERNDLNLDVHSSEYTLKGSPHYVLPCTPAQADSQDSQDRERPEVA